MYQPKYYSSLSGLKSNHMEPDEDAWGKYGKNILFRKHKAGVKAIFPDSTTAASFASTTNYKIHEVQKEKAMSHANREVWKWKISREEACIL